MSRIPSREEALLADALAQPPAERGAFLAQACGANVDLLAHLVALLSAHEGSETLLRASARESVRRNIPTSRRCMMPGSTETGRPYFVMGLVRGIPITKYCDENHLTPTARLDLFETETLARAIVGGNRAGRKGATQPMIPMQSNRAILLPQRATYRVQS